MVWGNRQCSHGGLVAERGLKHEGGVLDPSGFGCTMPVFIVYESSHFDTRRQAEAYIRRRTKS